MPSDGSTRFRSKSVQSSAPRSRPMMPRAASLRSFRPKGRSTIVQRSHRPARADIHRHRSRSDRRHALHLRRLGPCPTVEVYKRNGVTVDADPGTTGDQPETTRYAYDLMGNLHTERKANGVVANYVYDNLNRLDVLTEFQDNNDNGVYDSGDQLYAVRLLPRGAMASGPARLRSSGSTTIRTALPKCTRTPLHGPTTISAD